MRQEPVEITSIGQLTDLLTNEHGADGLMFRGQPTDEPLLPRIARLDIPASQAEDVEWRMLDDFMRWSVPSLEREPKDDWEWLAVAQHHRMATRLLDWTLNPLAALWFAVERSDRHSGPGVFWVFDPRRMTTVNPVPHPLQINYVRVYPPPHVSRRIAAQVGLFTVHPRLTEGFVPLEQDPSLSSHLTKCIVPRDKFSHLRWELDRCGVHSASLFPDLEGIARHVEWIHSVDQDEIPLISEPVVRLASA